MIIRRIFLRAFLGITTEVLYAFSIALAGLLICLAVTFIK